MAGGPSWKESQDTATWRLPGADHLGWWALAGFLLSIILHVLAFFALDRVKIALGFEQAPSLSTGPMKINEVETASADLPQPVPADKEVTPPKDLPELLDEMDAFDKLPKDSELDMRPDVKAAAFDLKIGDPVKSGSPKGNTDERVKGLDLELDLPDFGRSDSLMPRAADSQVVVDRGGQKLDEFDSKKIVDDLLSTGGGGKAEAGSLEGSLEDLLGVPANVLVGKTTVLPGDLLFEYNQSDLRESAKIGLAKLGLLMDMNPNLFCWIDGYSDLFGGDSFNYELSQRRAEAVKEYLVKSMRMDSNRIIPRGFGKLQPRVPGGSRDEQAPNRRVEIKMRKTPPDEPAPRVATAPAPTPPPEMPAPKAKPVQVPVPNEPKLVKPARALPVEEYEIVPAPAAPKAKPVQETPPAPRARPVQPEAPAPPKATRVQEEAEAPPRATPVPLRAEPVEE